MAAPSKRKPNWSREETFALIEQVSSLYSTLISKFESSSTNAMKKAAWACVCLAVNARGGQNRTIDEVKERWSQLQDAAKKDLYKRKTAPPRSHTHTYTPSPTPTHTHTPTFPYPSRSRSRSNQQLTNVAEFGTRSRSRFSLLVDH